MKPQDLSEQSETIVPVTPTVRARSPAPVAEDRGGAKQLWLMGGAAAAVLAASAFVFVVLPRWVERPAPAPAAALPAAAPAAAPQPALPELSAEELAALEAEAERLLAEILTQTSRLEEQGAAGWGGDDWIEYTERSKAGDSAFLDKRFQDAVTAYRDTLATGAALFERSTQAVERALAAAGDAFAAGNPELAIAQYDFVLGIDPENADAHNGRARAERLPEVLALVREADGLRDAGELDGAIERYRQALAIDSRWAPAQAGLDGTAARRDNERFEGLLSAGYAALAEQEYGRAAEQFHAALAMRPNAAAAREGLVQAEESAKLNEIALAEARALAFERRERWDQAIAQYEAALATDPTLAFAKSGLERATARADLDAKLANLIANPTLLFQDRLLADAGALLDDAAAVAEPGPRLAEQQTELARLMRLATTPLPVELRSDALTEVTVYRVGPLGVFTVKELELKPGTYTAIGSRNGYRDVRRMFTVLPGRAAEPISVVCSEPI